MVNIGTQQQVDFYFWKTYCKMERIEMTKIPITEPIRRQRFLYQYPSAPQDQQPPPSTPRYQ